MSSLAVCDQTGTNINHIRAENYVMLGKDDGRGLKEVRDNVEAKDVERFLRLTENIAQNSGALRGSERGLMDDEMIDRNLFKTQPIREGKDMDLIQSMNFQLRNQNQMMSMIQDMVAQVQDINRSVRSLQDEVNALVSKSENLEENIHQQTMSLSPTINRMKKDSARGPLFQLMEDIKDTTYFLAATLIKRENIPYLRRCNKTRDVSSCLRPEVSELYNDLRVPVRIVGGHFQHEGRVEVFYRGEWTTVCNYGWDDEDAEVVCKMLGYSGGSTLQGQSFLGGYYFKQGRGVIRMSNVQCTGDEESVLSCPFEKKLPSKFSHYDDAGVRCEK